MKVERYLLEYIREHRISARRMEQDTGINLQHFVEEGKELRADEFIELCLYLGITPDEVSDQIL
ncbi:MAG: hypothetical protein IJ801_00255 [Lachnospiraceae bacterium]|nr:hypothetical protein [Lachnospiraceae bacterium]